MGLIFGFSDFINPERFQQCVERLLDENPEIGVAIKIMPDGRHVLETEHGIEFIVQEFDGAMPNHNLVSRLSIEDVPLAMSTVDAGRLVDRSLPLLGFRITHFNDGRSALGARITHSHLDGTAFMQLLINLCKLYSGGKTESPFTDRQYITQLATGSGTSPSGKLPIARYRSERSAEQNASLPECRCYNVTIEMRQLDEYVGAIKSRSSELSSSDVLTALCWKAWASFSTNGAVVPSRLYGHFNIRNITELRIPHTYQGNAMIDRMVEIPFGVVRTTSTLELARRYRRSLKPLKGEDIAIDIAYLNRLQKEQDYGKDGMYRDFSRGFDVDAGNGKALAINDIRKMNFDQVDLAGKALWCEPANDFHDRNMIDISTCSDGAIIFSYLGTEEAGPAFERSINQIVAHQD